MKKRQKKTFSTRKRGEKSIPKRIPKKLLKKIEKRGGGDFRKGLYKMDKTCEIIENEPAIILQRELEHFSGLVEAFSPDNHFESYMSSNLPAVLHKFIKTGRVDHTILNNRKEKSIDVLNKNNGGKKQDGES